jgi:pimeloyl-[acyl-carrier protein] synthase
VSRALPLYNPFLPEFRRNPYPIYAAIREREPVHRFAGFKGEQWLLTRHRDVRQLLADTRFAVDDLPDQMRSKTRLSTDGFDVLIACIKDWLFFRDPPGHGPVRRLFSRELSPAGVERHRNMVLSIVDTLLDRALAKGDFDLIADVAYPLPALVMARLQGIPASSLGMVMDWSTKLFRVLVPPQSIDAYERMDRLVREFVRFFEPHIANARKESSANLLGLLTRAEADGEIDEAGVFSLAIMLFSVGQETTENLLGNGLLGLLSHPDQADCLREDPLRHAEAVDEMLRYDTPVQGVARITRQEVAIGDVTLPAGARVNFSLGAANRDPEQFDQPDRFLLRRAERNKLPFGAGVHFCLGAHLARLQAECVVRRLFERAPHVRLNADTFEWRESVLLRGVKALPLSTSEFIRQAASR